MAKAPWDAAMKRVRQSSAAPKARSWTKLFPIQIHHGLGPGMDMEFVVDGVQMSSHGLHAQTELPGDFLVEKALGQEVDDLLFAWSHGVASLIGLRRTLKGFNHAPRNL
jgi:hypothetical protein